MDDQNASDDITATWFTTAVAEAKARVFQIVFFMSRADARLSDEHTAVLLGRGIVFMQLLSFVFAPEMEFPWNEDYIGWLKTCSTIFRFDRLVVGDSIHDGVPLVFIVIVALMISAWLVYCIWLSIEFRSEQETVAVRKYASHLVMLRRVSEVMSTVAYIPILSIMLTGARCGTGHDTECGSASHILVTTIGTIFAFIFFVLSSAMVLFYANRHPMHMMRRHVAWMKAHNRDHDNAHVHPQSVWLSRTHARVDIITHLLVTLLVVIFSGTSDHGTSSRWLVMIIITIVFAGGAALNLLHLPYYTFSANIFHTTMWCVLLWASVCGLITQGYDDPTLVAGAVIFFAGIPLVAGVAHFACITRRQKLTTMHVADVQHPADIELHVRFMVQDFEQQLEDANSSGRNDDESEALLVDKNAEDELVKECDAWMQYGARKYSRDDVLLVSRARFLHFYYNDQHRVAMALAEAAERDPQLDCVFDIYMQRKETELTFRRTEKGHNVLSYLRYVDLLVQAEKHTALAYRAQYEFWSQMVEAEPDQGILLRLGNEVNDHVKAAHGMFREAMGINNLSPLTTRNFAEFTTRLLNNEDEGKILLQRAQELERKRKVAESERERSGGSGGGQSKARIEDVTRRIFNDETCVITISGEPESSGIIRSANAACCQLFGRVHTEMLGNNVSTLMPPPFSEMHNSYLKRFHLTGRGSVIDRTRALFGLHKNGFLMPFNLTVMEVLGMDTVVFMGIVERLQLDRNEHLMLVETVSGTVVRTTSQCSALLGLSSRELMAGGRTVFELLPGVNLDKHLKRQLAYQEQQAAIASAAAEYNDDDNDASSSSSSSPDSESDSDSDSGSGSDSERVRDAARRKRRARMRKRGTSKTNGKKTKKSKTATEEEAVAEIAEVLHGQGPAQEGEPVFMEKQVGAMDLSVSADDMGMGSDEQHAELEAEDVPDELEIEVGGYRVSMEVHHDSLSYLDTNVTLLRVVETNRARIGDEFDSENGDARVEPGPSVAPQRAALGMMNAFDESDQDNSGAEDAGGDATRDGHGKVAIHGSSGGKPLKVVVPLAQRTGLQDSPAVSSSDSPRTPNTPTTPDEATMHPSARHQLLPLMLSGPSDGGASDSELGGELEMAVMDEDAIAVRDRDADVASARSGNSRKSGGSGFSANSRSSTVMIRSAIERIRSQFLVRHNKMDGAIMGLRIAFFAMVIIMVTMAIVGQTVTDTAITDYQDQVDKILKSGARRSYAVTLGYQTRTLDMIRRNVLPRSFIEPTFADMIELAASLEHDNNDLALHDDKISRENRELYEHQDLEISELVGGHVQTRRIGLLQAITLIISHSKLIAGHPIEEISTELTHVYFMIKNTNGIDGIVEFINKSTIYYEKATVDAADVVFELQLILLCVSMGVMAAMLLCVIRPTINRVERVRMEVFDMFIEIPAKNVASLQTSAMNMLDDDMMSQMDAVEEDADREAEETAKDGARGDTGAGAGGGMKGPAHSDRGGGKSSHHHHSGHHDVNRRRRTAAKSGKDKYKRGLRKYKNEQRSFWVLFGKVCALLAIAGAFYAYAYTIETSALQQAVDRLPELNYAGRRRFFARSSLVEYREAVLQPYTANGRVPTVMEEKERLVYESVGFLRAIQQSLMFGNPDYKLEGAIHRLSTRDELMYSDACPYVTDLVPNCRTWNEGIMTHGLDSALEDYLRRIVDGTYTIARLYESGNWTRDTANTTIRNPDQELLREYDRIYLEKGLQVAASQHSDEERKQLQDMLSFRAVMMGIFLAVVVSLYLVVYDPMIRRLDVELKRTRGMLLMIPENLLVSTPSLRKMMNQAKF